MDFRSGLYYSNKNFDKLQIEGLGWKFFFCPGDDTLVPDIKISIPNLITVY